MLSPSGTSFVFSQSVLVRKGVPDEEAKLISETLVTAHLRGVESHGLIRLPIYLKRIEAGSLRPKAKVTVVRETSTTALLDGHQSFGQLAGHKAMTLAMEKAGHCGVGAVGVRNSEHFGTAAFFAMMALKKKMIGISITNTTPMMAPWGGSEKLVGNNPIAFAVPAGKMPPVVLDVSMSVASMGKVLLASQGGKKVPPGWGKDKAGAVTEDPAEIIQGGSLCPIGNYKGYGLAVVFDIFCGVLTGSGYGSDIRSIYKEVDKANRCGHFMLALNIKEFIPVIRFERRMEDLVRRIKESPRAQEPKSQRAKEPKSQRAKERERIYLPGEIEYLMEQERVKKGIPLEKSLVMDLNHIGAGLDVKPLSG